MGWAKLGLVAFAVVAAACTSDPDPGDALRTSAIWTRVDDDLPLLASRERSTSGSAEHGCVSYVELHELAGPDERALTLLEDVATDEGWEVQYRHPIVGSAEGTIDGPAAQMIVVRRMGETTLHEATSCAGGHLHRG